MKEKISAIYERLQTLDILPTKRNMEKLITTLYELEEVFKEIERTENDGENGRAESDPD